MPDLTAFAFIDPAVNILLMDVITKPISYPEPSNFLRRMLDGNEGLWKGLVLIVRK